MTPLNQALQKAKELENILHISTLLSPLAREQARIDIRERIEIMFEDGEIKEGTDPYDVVIRAYEEDPIFKHYNVAPLREEGQRLNLLYPKIHFEELDIPPELVAQGAKWIANNTSNLIFGLNRELMSPKEYDLFKQQTLEKRMNTGLVDPMHPFLGPGIPAVIPEDVVQSQRMPEGEVQIMTLRQSAEARMEQQILDDLMAGNAPYMYKALIPRSGGQEGYWIGVFVHNEDQSPTNAKLIGAMMTKEGDKLVKHVVTNEQLVGVSASDQILEYLTSWFFDYNHENVKKLYKEGRKPEDRQRGTGRAVETEGMFPSVRRAFSTMFENIGDLEFNHAISPLYQKMEEKALEVFGESYNPDIHHLNEEVAQDVLTEFMDEFKRPFSFLQQLPGSSVTVPVARWINNLWELDINLREIWNRGPQPKYEQANPIPSYP